MNITCLTGVILCFGWIFINYNSLAAIIAILNGIIYYLNPDSKYGRYNDIAWNLFFTISVILVTPSSALFVLLGLLFWIINNLTINNNILHVLSVQFPFSLALRHSILYT